MSASWSDSFKFLPQGAIIQEFKIGGRNIVLGYPDAAAYKTEGTQYFGETIGRTCNRISGAKVQLNGKTYDLAPNEAPNTLHGGNSGWGKKTFDGPTPVQRDGRDAVQFKYLSKDGEEGFPGTVELRVWYFPSVQKDGGVEKTTLEIEYEVEFVGDEADETVIGVTNHSYFNISDGPTIEGTRAKVATNLHLPVDAESIPTGAIEPFPGVPANEEFTMGPVDPAPDHCFIMNTDPSSVPIDTRAQPLRTLIELYHPGSKIHFEALSTEPAFQWYAGKGVDQEAKGGAPARGSRAGMCVEASRYVNAANDERWRGMVKLKKGAKFGSRTVYRGWVGE